MRNVPFAFPTFSFPGPAFAISDAGIALEDIYDSSNNDGDYNDVMFPVLVTKIVSLDYSNGAAAGATITNPLTPTVVGGGTYQFQGLIPYDATGNAVQAPNGFNFQYVTAGGGPAAGISATPSGPNASGVYEFNITVGPAVLAGTYDVIVTIKGQNPALRKRIYIKV